MGVYALSMAVFALSALLLYFRVFRLILLGRPSSRFDQPLRRLKGAIPLILGQRKVLQEVSLRRDRAGLAHFFIFWGFLSFTTSYLLFIFGDSIWRELSSTLLTDTGVRIFASYLDILAVTFFAVLAWAAVRRWLVRPHRLTFDLTQKKESAVILLLITSLMALTLLTEAFHTASGADDVHASALVSSALGGLFADAGVGQELGQKPAEPLLVAAPRGDPGILPVHPTVEAYAHRGRAHQLPDPPVGAQRHPVHPPGPGDGG